MDTTDIHWVSLSNEPPKPNRLVLTLTADLEHQPYSSQIHRYAYTQVGKFDNGRFYDIDGDEIQPVAYWTYLNLPPEFQS